MNFSRALHRVQIVCLVLIVVSSSLGEATAQQTCPPATCPSISSSTNADGILFSENGKPVLQFQAKPKSINGGHTRANYIHPLWDLDGNVVTEDFPRDHLHHRGIFWAWHQVNVGDVSAGDSWLTKDFNWKVTELDSASNANGAVQLTANVQWTSPKIKDDNGNLLTIVSETTRITIYPTSGNCRLLDFDIQLLADQPNVSIGGSEDVKGYGGFSVRLQLPDDIEFRAKDGVVKPQKTALDCGNWVDLVATFGQSKSRTGVAIFVHPTSAGYPQQWILRAKKSMQNPVYPGRTPVAVSRTKPTVLRYRLVLHNKLYSAVELQRMFAEYRLTKFGDQPKANTSQEGAGGADK